MTTADVVRAVRWYLREVTGETAYDRYVAHARGAHGDAPVLSRREFERRRMDAREVRPGSRCC
ncbi:MAG TPA: YbdD/YjiX family protein [Mycobacteriales bacterium]|nr:YbdD/YjiX family protein [Mycobacteriales bacterium]